MIYLEIALASVIAGALDTVVGFGGGLLLLPVLALAIGSKDAVLLTAVIPLGWNAVRIPLLRQFINWKAAGMFTLGIIPGSFLGAFVLKGIDTEILRLVIGIILSLMGLYHILRMYFELPTLPRLGFASFPLFGFIAGAISSIAGAGNGPIHAAGLTAAGLGVREVAVTNGVLGPITSIGRIAGYWQNGLLIDFPWLIALVGLTGAIVGGIIGVRLSLRTRDTTIELLIAAVITIAGIRLLF